MQIGLFSDIHANREALEASLDHARRAGICRFIFLGDYVGYGADPSFAVDTVMREVERGAVALLGNHDAAIAGGTAGMNPVAAKAINWTRPQLNNTQREFLAQLPLTFEADNRLFVHASAHIHHGHGKRLAQFHGDACTSDILWPRSRTGTVSSISRRKPGWLSANTSC
jgi:predicted phosphodiesterase